MAKHASNQAYVRAKRDMEEAEMRRQNGQPELDTSDKDVFEVQHHHLLNCLEKTTVRESNTSAGFNNIFLGVFY